MEAEAIRKGEYVRIETSGTLLTLVSSLNSIDEGDQDG